MDFYYININDNEYFIPNTAFIDMESETANYVQSMDDKKYLAISKMKREGNYSLLKKTYDRCNFFTGSVLLDTPEGEKYSQKGPEFRNIDNRSNFCISTGKIERACDLYINGIELSLKAYNDFVNEETKSAGQVTK